MKQGSEGTRPMFERSESWTSALGPAAVLSAVAKEFSTADARVEASDTRLEVRIGSNLTYRLWGELLQWGQKAAPVALEIRVQALQEGSRISAYVHDTFGFRLTEQTFFGAEKTFEEKIERMLSRAANAAKVASRRTDGGT